MVGKMKRIAIIATILLLIVPVSFTWGQKNPNGPPMFINVNVINLEMKKLMGEGQFTTQYSWMLTGLGPEKTEIWYYPADEP